MSEIQSIHDFDLELVCEYFAGLERQGPGSPDVTTRALDFVDGLNEESLIADIGCGTGGQTMVLARRAPGKITGIDLFPRFIDLFNKKCLVLDIETLIQSKINMARPKDKTVAIELKAIQERINK